MADEDTRLVSNLLAGDSVAIRQVRAWIASTLGRYRGRLGSEFEDLEQDVVLDLMEALSRGRFRAESRLETYVRSFARFRCIDRLRARGRHDMVELDEGTAVDGSRSPLEELTEREAEDLAGRVLASLPPPCRELWELVAKGLSYREMGEILGLAEGALRVRAYRCRQRALEARRRLLSGEPL